MTPTRVMMGTRRTSLLWAIVAGLASPLGVQGQAQQHDVTSGIPVTAPAVPVRISPTSLPPTLAVDLDRANLCAAEHLAAGVLASTLSGETVPYPVQQALLEVLLDRGSSEAFGRALARGGPVEPAERLVEALLGLASDRRAGQLAEAIERFNDLAESRSEAFMARPSDEIVAVHAALSMLVLNGPCEPLERVEVCVLEEESMLTRVGGVVHPATRDTVLDGRPIDAALDSLGPQYGPVHEWFVRDLPITFEYGRFAKSGEPRAFPMDSLRRVGVYGEVALFAHRDSIRPYSELLVPVGPRCEFQPYAPGLPISVCVVTPRGEIATVEATFRAATGDTLVAGRPFHEVHHSGERQYAAGRDWFIENQPMEHEGEEYVPFGVPRVPIEGLRRVGEHDGVPLFAETTSTDPHPMLFIPIGPGCAFQPYLARSEIRVRG